MLASGATVVSGNAWWSGKELDHALSVATPVLVIADDRRAQMIPDEYPVMRIPLNLTATRCGSSLVEEGPFEEDLPAVVVFTSGTTGAPKAAELSPVGDRESTKLPRREEAVAVGSARGSSGRHHTDNSAALSHGWNPVDLRCAADGRQARDSHRTFRCRDDSPAHRDGAGAFWGAVPTMINRVIDHPDITARNTSSLRSVTVSGTRVTPQMIEQVRAAFPSTVRSAGTIYGMTEAGAR